jgi:hypothetical protein
MSKIMSILEKCNLVEKVNKEKPEHANLNEENNTQLDEMLKDDNSILKVDANDYKEEIKAPQPVIKEKISIMETDIEYENKMMINEIYSLYGLENSDINTVFMLQNLINALPQNLPKDVVKQSVINIIGASNIDLNELLSDGERRQEVLAKVMDGYYNQTNKRIALYKEEIAKLSSLINNCEEQIKIKESMLEQQIYLIKYETQKIDGIIDFFPK